MNLDNKETAKKENLDAKVIDKKKISIDQQIGNYFLQYKEFLLPIGIIIVCIFIFLKVVNVQVQDLFLIKEQEKTEVQKLTILKNNLNILSKTSDSQLDSQLQTAYDALPSFKDFAGVLNAVNNAAINAGVGVDDYSLVVGDLSTASAKLSAKLPAFDIKLSISRTGGILGTKRFLTELSKALPLAEVRDFEASENSANLMVSFYYKTITPSKFSYYSPVKMLTPKDLVLINEISKWQVNMVPLDFPISTSSAQKQGEILDAPFQ